MGLVCIQRFSIFLYHWHYGRRIDGKGRRGFRLSRRQTDTSLVVDRNLHFINSSHQNKKKIEMVMQSAFRLDWYFTRCF